MKKTTVELQLPPEMAWDRLKTAAEELGKVEEAHENSHYLLLKARYGLNPVRLRISVLSGPTAETSRLEIHGPRSRRLGRRQPQSHRPAVRGDMRRETKAMTRITRIIAALMIASTVPLTSGCMPACTTDGLGYNPCW
ncbi:hypothetical protein [Mycobacterium sp. M23085]|uniref:hypothetical protein n=1 Tax=Mycobacterium sp. M23085 TaxID=3378087 RepID=UPI00387829A2